VGWQTHLATIVRALNLEECGVLLGFCREWNTNSRHSHIAQSLLGYVLKTFAPADLKKIPNVQKVIEAIIPYTGLFGFFVCLLLVVR
jgi:U3 small nucleolar RNA-associated protein 13